MAFTQNYASSISYSSLGNPNFQSGDREDLTDVISMISPETLPVLNLAAKSKAQATYHEWQMDDLLPVITNGIPEAQDFSSFTNEAAPRVRTGNFVQRIGDSFGVSVEQSLVNIAGVQNEYDRARMKKTKEILRSLEASICSANDMSAGGSNGATMRGAFSWISSSAQTNNPVPSAYLTPSASITATSSSGTVYAESTFKGMIQSVYSQTGDVSIGYDFVCGPGLKNLIAGYVKSATVSSTALDLRRLNAPVDGKTLMDGIDVYDSDFGRIRIIPSLFLSLTNGANPKNVNAAATASYNQKYSGLLLRPELLEVAYLREIGSQELPDLGGGRRGFVDVLATLVVKNPLGLGKVTYA